MKWSLSLSLPLAVAAAFGQPGTSAVSRDGGYWTQTASGTVNVPAQARLQIESTGSVVVRGQAGGEISYTLRKRVRGGSEADARRVFEQISVRSRMQGNTVVLVTDSPSGRHPIVDLEVRAPKTLQQVRLRTNGGAVEAYDLDGEVDAETGGGVVRLDRIGKRASAISGGGELAIGTVNGPVRAMSGGGSIRIDKAGGDATVESAGGSVTVKEAWGPLRVATAGGNISVEKASAGVSATTAGGMIEVGTAAGGVKCVSAAGAIRLKNVSGALNADTMAGSIIAELVGNHLLNSVLRTAVGDVTVFIPSNVAVTVRARNESGGRTARIVSDFPEVRIQATPMSTSVAEGTINGGGPVLAVSTANGTIYLRRQK
jgi:hypothetical protein